MAEFDTFTFDSLAFDAAGGGGGGTFDDFAAGVTFAAGSSIVRAGTVVELADDDLASWSPLISAGWLIDASDNVVVDPRPVPHPDW